MLQAVETTERYRAVGARQVLQDERFQALSAEVRRGVEVLSHVLPFRTNQYVVDELVDWERSRTIRSSSSPFPSAGCSSDVDYGRMGELLGGGAAPDVVDAAVRDPDRPESASGGSEDSQRAASSAAGPSRGCSTSTARRSSSSRRRARPATPTAPTASAGRSSSACEDLKFERASRTPRRLPRGAPRGDRRAHHRRRPDDHEDRALRRYVEPLLTADLEHVQTIRIGTKALAYWPQRFVTDDDADDLLRLFEEVVAAAARSRSWRTSATRASSRRLVAGRRCARIRATGAESDAGAAHPPRQRRPRVWAEMWRTGCGSGPGAVLHVRRARHRPKNYFEVPLARAHQIFRGAYRRGQRPGAHRARPVDVGDARQGRVAGRAEIRARGLRARFLQARNPTGCGGRSSPFFFDGVRERTAEERRLLALPVAS
jgi:hypothetical protein